jgi:hypothetical protein
MAGVQMFTGKVGYHAAYSARNCPCLVPTMTIPAMGFCSLPYTEVASGEVPHTPLAVGDQIAREMPGHARWNKSRRPSIWV